MRKLLSVLLLMFGCLTFVGQAVASSTAGYGDCCLHGCKGMTQCASAACQACAVPQPAPLPSLQATAKPAGTLWPLAETPFRSGALPEPWTPPD